MQRPSLNLSRNLFLDGQTVDQDDLRTEQNFNLESDAAVVQNHVGVGALLETLTPRILWNSDELSAEQAGYLAAGEFDGRGLNVSQQPSDTVSGNQIAIELSDSLALGRRAVRVALIGLNFNSELIMETFEFYRNETQISKQHFTRILSFLVNDFKGNSLCSEVLGGTLLLREAKPFEMSRDCRSVSNILEPNIFWRDWKIHNQLSTLDEMLQEAIGPEYSVDALGINTTGLEAKELPPNDVTLQLGQKFQATANNIQKITLLIGVEENTSAAPGEEFDWSGDLVFTIYSLQTTVNCSDQYVPSLAIEFDPNPIPLGQISFTQETLKEAGYILNDVLQPIDFVLPISKLNTSGSLTVGNYYAFTVKRGGIADIGTLQFGVGRNLDTSTRLTWFNSVWVDVPSEALWFEIWSDTIKLANGQGYDSGYAFELPKTQENELAVLEDYCLEYQNLSTIGENNINYGVLEAVNQAFAITADERTGTPVNSRQKFVPQFSFLNLSGLNDLKEIRPVFTLGCVSDTNPRRHKTVDGYTSLPGLAKNDIFRIYEPNAAQLSTNFLGSKLIPNVSRTDLRYRVIKQITCLNYFGDVNGDGIIDDSDLERLSELLNEAVTDSGTQAKIVSGEIDILELLRADVDGDGYVTSNDASLLNDYLNRNINAFPAGSSFRHLELWLDNFTGRFDNFYPCGDGYARLDGYNSSNLVELSSLTDEEKELYGLQGEVSLQTDPAFVTIPFESVEFEIEPKNVWRPEWLVIHNDLPVVPAVFVEDGESETTSNENCSETFPTINTINCTAPANSLYAPNNFHLGGNLLNPDGTFYAVDLEVASFILELPVTDLIGRKFNIFDNLLKDASNGRSLSGLLAPKYADGTTVQQEDLALGRIFVTASLQSLAFAPDGYASDGYNVNINYQLGVEVDFSTTLLSLETYGLQYDTLTPALRSKILITAYLRKSGWKNSQQTLGPTQLVNLSFIT